MTAWWCSNHLFSGVQDVLQLVDERPLKKPGAAEPALSGVKVLQDGLDLALQLPGDHLIDQPLRY